MVGQLVSVEGKVVANPAKCRYVDSFEKHTKVSDNNVVADSTGSIQLILWEEWVNYFEDKSDHFKLFNLQVKYYDKMFLSSCSETFADEVADPGIDIKVELSDEVHEITVAEFDCVGRFQYSFLCFKCKRQIVPDNNIIEKCNNCGNSSKRENLSKSL